MPRPLRLEPNNLPRLRSDAGLKNVVGPHVRAARRALKLTQDQVCARLDILTRHHWPPSRLDLSAIESGRRAVGDTELIALAYALECSATELLFGNEAQPREYPFTYPPLEE